MKGNSICGQWTSGGDVAWVSRTISTFYTKLSPLPIVIILLPKFVEKKNFFLARLAKFSYEAWATS
jgi:hypothetical protein